MCSEMTMAWFKGKLTLNDGGCLTMARKREMKNKDKDEDVQQWVAYGLSAVCNNGQVAYGLSGVCNNATLMDMLVCNNG